MDSRRRSLAPPLQTSVSPGSCDLRIGTSGWQYEHWRGVLYGDHQPHEEWLQTYVQAFSTVEVNNTFYRLPEASVFERWGRSVPDDFVFAVKASRYLTHIKRLGDPEEPVARFVSRARQMGRALGPVLLQLPPTLEIEADRLRHTLEQFPTSVPVAVEFRHDSWWVPHVAAILRERRAALVISNRGGRWLEPVWDGHRVSDLWDTADWSYVRLHSGSASSGNYNDDELTDIARRLEAMDRQRAAYVYFNNDAGGHAVRNAVSTSRSLGVVAGPMTRATETER